MTVTEYIFREYKALTSQYVGISQKLRELLPRIVELSKKTKLTDKKFNKELILEFETMDKEIAITLEHLRNIRRTMTQML
ncbi:MAG: hypothetical protein KAI14_03215 [Dehalococcoidales bacterium]|nr:hypothetical protein [Dehalococcoidales bacterium]